MTKDIREQIKDVVLTEEEKKKLQPEEGKKWHDYQQKVLDSNSQKIAFATSRQAGKTEVLKEWAFRNNAKIITPYHRNADDIARGSRFARKDVIASNSLRTWDGLLEEPALAFEEVEYIDIPPSFIGRYDGRILMVGTDSDGGQMNELINFCLRDDVEVFTGSMSENPLVTESRIEELRNTMHPMQEIQEVDGMFVIDPNEL